MVSVKQEEMIMRKDLLLRLAAALEMDAANPTGIKFDIGTWAAKDGYNADADYDTNIPYLFKSETETVPVDCGTVACAVGFAAISGIFKDEGLTYKLKSAEGAYYLTPYFNGLDNFEAVGDFFEIDRWAVYHLFTGEGYEEKYDNRRLPVGAEGELAVAKQIREFVAAADNI